MSMLNRPANGNDLGEVIASTRDYEIAQKTVSKLIAAEVPARDIAIVGEGVRTVERVTGKLGYATAARSGAMNGVLIGLLLAAIMLFGTPEAPLTLFLGFVMVGVALGMIMSLVTYSIVRRRRDFASMTQMLAEHYEVRVQSASLAKARQVLGGAQRPATVRPPVDLSQPPQYGERIPAGEQGPAGPVVPPKPPLPGAGAGAGAGSDAAAGPDAPPQYGERVPVNQTDDAEHDAASPGQAATDAESAASGSAASGSDAADGDDDAPAHDGR